MAPGRGGGTALVLEEPLSFWGGVDPATGRVIDARHPQAGEVVAGRVLVVPAGRGSSSSSSVLAEAIRAGTGPAAVVLGEGDPIMALGSVVAAELYGLEVPVVVVGPDAYRALRTGLAVQVDAGADGTASVHISPPR
ncbi:MAG: DUF126 domain-containing protein [Actinobacteria bacterium]|nr:DUF126 domain-containing protein [Actinomycetota bacterium]